MSTFKISESLSGDYDGKIVINPLSRWLQNSGVSAPIDDQKT